MIEPGTGDRRKRGRPRREKPASLLSVRLDAEIHDSLSRFAILHGVTVAAIVRRGIALALRSEHQRA